MLKKIVAIGMALSLLLSGALAEDIFSEELYPQDYNLFIDEDLFKAFFGEEDALDTLDVRSNSWRHANENVVKYIVSSADEPHITVEWDGSKWVCDTREVTFDGTRIYVEGSLGDNVIVEGYDKDGDRIVTSAEM